MAQQTSVETIEEQIDFEMSKLEIDFNNGVQWSMRIIHKSLLRIKRKAEQAQEMHKEETLRFVRTMPKEKGITQEGEAYVQYDARKHYNETYNK
jgi:hypothetical protein